MLDTTTLARVVLAAAKRSRTFAARRSAEDAQKLLDAFTAMAPLRESGHDSPARQPAPKPVKPPTRRSPHITMADHILAYLAEHGPATGNEIAAAIGVDQTNTRQRCKGLYARGRLVHVGVAPGPSQAAIYGLVEVRT